MIIAAAHVDQPEVLLTTTAASATWHHRPQQQNKNVHAVIPQPPSLSESEMHPDVSLTLKVLQRGHGKGFVVGILTLFNIMHLRNSQLSAICADVWSRAFAESNPVLCSLACRKKKICPGGSVIHDPFPLRKGKKMLCVGIYHSITLGSCCLHLEVCCAVVAHMRLNEL